MISKKKKNKKQEIWRSIDFLSNAAIRYKNVETISKSIIDKMIKKIVEPLFLRFFNVMYNINKKIVYTHKKMEKEDKIDKKKLIDIFLHEFDINDFVDLKYMYTTRS